MQNAPTSCAAGQKILDASSAVRVTANTDTDIAPSTMAVTRLTIHHLSLLAEIGCLNQRPG